MQAICSRGGVMIKVNLSESGKKHTITRVIKNRSYSDDYTLGELQDLRDSVSIYIDRLERSYLIKGRNATK